MIYDIQGSKIDFFLGGPPGHRRKKSGGPSRNPVARPVEFLRRTVFYRKRTPFR